MIIPRNLLVVRTDRIGDVVLSLPLAGIIKKHYPECRITFLVREYTKQLVSNNSYIDDIIIIKTRDSRILLKENIEELSKHKFDTSIIVYPTFKTSLLIYLSRIKNRIGTGYRWYSFLFNNKVFEHRKYAERHELEYNVNLLKQLGISEELHPGMVDFGLHIKEDESNFVDNLLLLNKVETNKPIIIIHPGSAGSAVDLPQDKFKELVTLLRLNTDCEIILTGSKEEKIICDNLMIDQKVRNFAGKLDLKQLSALISRCVVFISNSTGPIHIAAALDKYIIGFYPKILACSPKRWGPYNEKNFIFLPLIDCIDCTREQCERLNCMNSIKVEDIFVTIQKILNLLKAKEI